MNKHPFLAAIIAAVLILPATSYAQWTEIRRAERLTVNAVFADDDLLYAGTDSGLFRSSDNGNTWIREDIDLHPIPEVYAIGCLPGAAAPRTLYAGTSQGVLRREGRPGAWVHAAGGLHLPQSERILSVQSLAISADSSGNEIVFAGAQEGLYRSTNQGEYWWPIELAPEPSWSLPPSEIRVLSCLRQHDGTYVLVIKTGSGSNLRMSSDLGQTWSRSDTIGPNVRPYCLTPLDAVLFLGTREGVFVSTDNGQRWSRKSSGIPENTSVTEIEVCRDSSGNAILAAGTNYNGIYFSRDTGATWIHDSTAPFANRRITALGFDAGSMRLFVGTFWHGMFRSGPDLNTWEACDDDLPLQISPRKEILSITGCGDRVFAGSSFWGMFSLDAEDLIWKYAPPAELSRAQIPSLTTLSSSSGSPVMLAGTYGKGVFRSFDCGATWSTSNEGLPDEAYIYTIVPAEDGVYIGSTGLFTSTDEGDTWREITVPGVDFSHVRTIARYGNVLYIGSDYQQLFRTSDEGSTWEHFSSGFPASASVHSFAAAKDQSGTTHLLAGTGVGLYHSNDDGNTWVQRSPEHTDSLVVNALTKYDRDGMRSILFAGTNVGIFYSSSYGMSWTKWHEGIPESVNCRTLNIHRDTIYAGTDNGTYMRPLSEIIVTAPPPPAIASTQVISSYPNPVALGSPVTVRYSLEHTADLTLRVTDILGRTVREVPLGQVAPGTHTRSIGTAGLEPGMYFYSIASGNGKPMDGKMVVR